MKANDKVVLRTAGDCTRNSKERPVWARGAVEKVGTGKYTGIVIVKFSDGRTQPVLISNLRKVTK